MSSSSAKLVGKTFLITGSTDGIGFQTARRLAKDGATILLHGRSTMKVEAARGMIMSENPDAMIKSYPYDLSTIAATREFAQHVISENDELHGLVNNAGVFSIDHSVTSDALETTFAVNVAAPFILFCLLMPLLKVTAQSKVLNVSSISQGGRIDLSNLQFQKGGFSEHISYSQSKLHIASISHELALRVSPNDALVLSCDPGTVNTKMLLAGWGSCGIEVGAANNEYELITAEFDPCHHGRYFVSKRCSRCSSDVYNDELRQSLWQELEQITGVHL